jgi:hypothetical protein
MSNSPSLFPHSSSTRSVDDTLSMMCDNGADGGSDVSTNASDDGEDAGDDSSGDATGGESSGMFITFKCIDITTYIHACVSIYITNVENK